MTTTHPFVTEVRRLLNERAESPTQDELDLFLLGQVVPAHPIPKPDPACEDCRGEGWVCTCHGLQASFARSDHAARLERCSCWR